MKKILFIPLMILFISISACGDKNDNKPGASIKENSNKDLKDEAPKDYVNLEAGDLNKHILAHFDLGQYEIGKEKLTFLIGDRPDLIETLGLTDLDSQFDEKLREISTKNEAIAEKERRLRMPNATKLMRSFEEEKTKFYVDEASPKFDSKETFHAYYTKDKTGKLKLYLKVKYIATSWLNIESYMVTVDQLDYEMSGNIEKTETRGKKRFKHETLDELIDTPKELEALNAIANGKEVKAVYVGDNTYKERNLTQEQIQSLRNVLDAYLFSVEKSMPELKEYYANN